MEVKLLKVFGGKYIIFFGCFKQRISESFLNLFFHQLFVDKNDLLVIASDQSWDFDGFNSKVAVDLYFYIFFSFFNFNHVCHLFETLNYVVHEVSKMTENVFVFELIHLGSATLEIVAQCLHETFLNGNSMALTSEVVVHEALKTIDQRHILSESPYECSQLELVVLSEMGCKS